MFPSAWRAALASAVLLAISACAANTSQTTPAEVQATAVRRTAQAEVQRIIAGNLSGTPTPDPTATPAPSCSGAIWWHEARNHLGQVVVVQGPALLARAGQNGQMWLDVGQLYPDPTGMRVLLPAVEAPEL